MEQINLSERLKRVADFLPQNSRMADIGSDHAYLPVYAVLGKKADFAIAGELNEGPFISANQTVHTYGLENQIKVRQGNGLNVIAKGEVNTIVIAGMGGSLIQSILEAGQDKLTPDMRLILQPNIGAFGLRKWLTSRQWQITAEDILEEDGHIYEIMTAHYTKEPIAMKENEMLLGPWLLQNNTSPVFQKKWKAEAEKTKQILKDLDKSVQTEAIQEKKHAFTSQLHWIERSLT